MQTLGADIGHTWMPTLGADIVCSMDSSNERPMCQLPQPKQEHGDGCTMGFPPGSYPPAHPRTTPWHPTHHSAAQDPVPKAWGPHRSADPPAPKSSRPLPAVGMRPRESLCPRGVAPLPPVGFPSSPGAPHFHPKGRLPDPHPRPRGCGGSSGRCLCRCPSPCPCRRRGGAAPTAPIKQAAAAAVPQ